MDSLKKVPRLAIVGGESLIARELMELLSELKPQPAVDLVSGEADSAKLARDDEGEAIVLTPMSAASFAGARAVILAGTAESSLRAAELTAGSAYAAGGSYRRAGRESRRAIARADGSNRRTVQPCSGFTSWPIRRRCFWRCSTAASRDAGRFSGRWCTCSNRRANAASGAFTSSRAQAVNLLSLKPLPKDVFDAQVGFNLLPAYGTEAPEKLEEFEARIERHLATLLLISSRAPMPSVRLVQAPVFHGYSGSVWMEFESSPGVDELARGAGVVSDRGAIGRTRNLPTNVGAAGQSGISAGDIRQDRNNPRAYWFWLVADNIRTYAESAVEVVREFL